MSAPFTPNDFKACISDPTASLCGNFIKTLLQLPVLVYKLVNYLFDGSGNLTKAFLNSVNLTGTYTFSAWILPEDGTRLLCDGRAVSQTLYPELYGAIGASYDPTSTAGPGNFRLPDFRAKFPVGIGTFTAAGTIVVGVAAGEDKHLLTVTEQGSLDVTTQCDDGDAQTGARVSLQGLTINTHVFGNAGADGIQGPTNIKLKADAVAHPIIPPCLGVYVFINT